MGTLGVPAAICGSTGGFPTCAAVFGSCVSVLRAWSSHRTAAAGRPCVLRLWEEPLPRLGSPSLNDSLPPQNNTVKQNEKD